MTKLLVSVLIAAVCLPVGVVAASEPESLRQAAEEGATEDQYRYAAALEAAGQYKRAVRWYERAAGDSPEAALALAGCLLDGRGTRADPVKAVALLKDASGAGLVRAQYLLGLQYQEGNGVGHDVEAAARWLGAAADSGHAGAQMRASAQGLIALLTYGIGALIGGSIHFLLAMALSRGSNLVRFLLGVVTLINVAAAFWGVVATHGEQRLAASVALVIGLAVLWILYGSARSQQYFAEH